MRNMDFHTIVFISLCILHLSTLSEGRPLRKRTVSEVQLMHNLREHQQLQERRDWLQLRLRSLHTAAARGRSPEAARARRRRPRPEQPPGPELTPEEIQALTFLEKLLKSPQT
ncbi:parathyroid hormone 1a [Hippoglossus hippoglossus]|uniref:parathyroid hormone 1a n=1 Tax=Hippoglossus hippoglossus TaxID=8267 RepID=UPI00148B5B73|nr:parathyroid hormone 1a [Hippoglossus hippoglossus]XP_035013269.1 parathyroid hormone 1a [Hippoglossus stenolepis]